MVFKTLFYCWHCYRCSHFPSFAHFYPTLSLISLWPSPHCCLCLWDMRICSLTNPFIFFHPTHLPLSSLAVCSMYSCLYLFLSLVCSLLPPTLSESTCFLFQFIGFIFCSFFKFHLFCLSCQFGWAFVFISFSVLWTSIKTEIKFHQGWANSLRIKTTFRDVPLRPLSLFHFGTCKFLTCL